MSQKNHVQFFFFFKKKKKLSRLGPRKSKERKKKKKKEKRGMPKPYKIKRKKNRQYYRPKKKKKRQLDEAHVHMHTGIFCNQEKMQPHSIFSPFQGENILVSSGRKHLSPPFIFLPSHPTKHTLKKISFTFSLHSFLSTLFLFQTNTPK